MNRKFHSMKVASKYLILQTLSQINYIPQQSNPYHPFVNTYNINKYFVCHIIHQLQLFQLLLQFNIDNKNQLFSFINLIQKMFDFNDPNIQVHMCKFQVDIKKARICIKFPCSYFVEWRTINNRYCISTQSRVKATNQQAIFNQKLTFYTQMIYNTKRIQYYSKQTFLILNLVSRSRPDQIKLVGRISIDLADILNRNRYRQMTHMKLNYCSVQSSLLFSINLIDKRPSSLSVKDLDKSAFTYVFQKFSDYFSLNSVNRLIVDENIEKNYNYRFNQYNNNSVQNINVNRRGEMGANIQNMTRGYNSIDSYNDMKKKNNISPMTLISKNDFLDDKDKDNLPKFKNPSSDNKFANINDDDTMSFKFKNHTNNANNANNSAYKQQQLIYNPKTDPHNKANRVGIAHIYNNRNDNRNNDSNFFQKPKQIQKQKQDSLIQKLLIKQQIEPQTQPQINIHHNNNIKKLAQSDSVSKFSQVESQSHFNFNNNNQQLSSIVDRLQKQKLQQEQMIKSLREIIKSNINKKKKQQAKQSKNNNKKEDLRQHLQQIKPTTSLTQNQQNQPPKLFQINIRNQNAVYEEQEKELRQNQKRIQQLQNQLNLKQTQLNLKQNQLHKKQNQLKEKQILLQEMKNRILNLQEQNQKIKELKEIIKKNKKQEQNSNYQKTLIKNDKNDENNNRLINVNYQNLNQFNQCDTNNDNHNNNDNDNNGNEIIISISKNPQIYQQQQKDILELLQRVNELQSQLKLYKQQSLSLSNGGGYQSKSKYKKEKQSQTQIEQHKQNQDNKDPQIKILITRQPNIYEQQQNQILELTKTLELQQEQLMNSVKRISMLQKQLDYKKSKQMISQQDQQEFKFNIKRDEQIYEQQQRDLTQMSNRIIELQEKLGYYSRLDKIDKNKEFKEQKNQNPHQEQSQNNYAIKVSKGQDIYEDQQRQIQELTKTVQQLTQTIQKMDLQLNMYRQMANNSKTQKQIIQSHSQNQNQKEDKQKQINPKDCLTCSQHLQKIKQLEEQITNLQEQKFFADSTQQLKSRIEELNNEIDLLKAELQISQKHRKQKGQSLQQEEGLPQKKNIQNSLPPHPQQKQKQNNQQFQQVQQNLIENLREQLDYLSKENINLKQSLVILQQQTQEQAQTIYVLQQQVFRLSKEKEVLNEKEVQLKRNMEKKLQQVQKQYQNKINNLQTQHQIQNNQTSIKQKSQSKVAKTTNYLNNAAKLQQTVSQIQNLIQMRKPLSTTLITTISQKLSQLPQQVKQAKQVNLTTDYQLLDCQVKKIKAQIMKIRDKPYSQKSKLINLFKPLQNSILKIKQTQTLNNFTKIKVKG